MRRLARSAASTLPTRQIRALAAAASAPPSATTHDASPAGSAAPSPAAQARQDGGRREKPYFVGRTHSNNLPVFHDTKAGGNQKWTLVKKGQGDVPALADHLRAALELPRDTVKVNPVNNHIMIKV